MLHSLCYDDKQCTQAYTGTRRQTILKHKVHAHTNTYVLSLQVTEQYDCTESKMKTSRSEQSTIITQTHPPITLNIHHMDTRPLPMFVSFRKLFHSFHFLQSFFFIISFSVLFFLCVLTSLWNKSAMNKIRFWNMYRLRSLGYNIAFSMEPSDFKIQDSTLYYHTTLYKSLGICFSVPTTVHDDKSHRKNLKNVEHRVSSLWYPADKF